MVSEVDLAAELELSPPGSKLRELLEELQGRRNSESRIRKMVRDVTGIHATFVEDAVGLGLDALVRDAKSSWGSPFK